MERGFENPIQSLLLRLYFGRSRIFIQDLRFRGGQTIYDCLRLPKEESMMLDTYLIYIRYI